MEPHYGFSLGEGISSLLSWLPIFVVFPDYICECLVEEVQMLLEMGREKGRVSRLPGSHAPHDHTDYFSRRTRDLQTAQSHFPRLGGGT